MLSANLHDQAPGWSSRAGWLVIFQSENCRKRFDDSLDELFRFTVAFAQGPQRNALRILAQNQVAQFLHLFAQDLLPASLKHPQLFIGEPTNDRDRIGNRAIRHPDQMSLVTMES